MRCAFGRMHLPKLDRLREKINHSYYHFHISLKCAARLVKWAARLTKYAAHLVKCRAFDQLLCVW